jgi:hypothetical protein
MSRPINLNFNITDIQSYFMRLWRFFERFSPNTIRRTKSSLDVRPIIALHLIYTCTLLRIYWSEDCPPGQWKTGREPNYSQADWWSTVRLHALNFVNNSATKLAEFDRHTRVNLRINRSLRRMAIFNILFYECALCRPVNLAACSGVSATSSHLFRAHLASSRSQIRSSDSSLVTSSVQMPSRAVDPSSLAS